MTQDSNHTIVNGLRAVIVATMMSLTGSHALADGVVVKGNVYGGGNLADVKTNTEVNMSTGTVEGSVYGGGNVGSVGTYTTSADMKTFTFTANTGTCNVTIDNGSIGTGVSMSQDGTFANGNVYGAGKGEADTYWCEKAMVYKTNVTINGGTVNGTVYGGGQIGRVENDATVIIGVETPTNSTPAPIIAGNVFGAGAGKETHGYSALLRGDAKLTIQGNARVGLNVYGGGEEASVGRFKIVGGRPSEPDNDGSGDCTVNVRGGAVIGTNTDDNITDKGNVFGTCKGVAAPATFTAYDKEYKSMQAVVQKAPVGDSDTAWEYVEGSTDYYWEYYPTLDAYQGFLNTLALTSHPVVTIGGMLSNETTGAVIPSGNPTVNGSVYGGGQRGITLGTVAVNIAGGTVNQDVYGGGALADTNAGNWDADDFTEVTGLTADVSSVTGLYTLSGTTYTIITDEDAKAVSGTTYYRKGKWADATLMTRKYTTTVDLTGGTIKGDAYGGGLGQKTGFNSALSNIEATVWGDIDVTLNGTKFDITYYEDEGYTDVVKSGRVFGCNNLLGSPQGDVTVTVEQTVAGNYSRTTGKVMEMVDGEMQEIDKRKSQDPDNHSYELAAVYGGGNLAPYETTGKKAHVIIKGCDLTSILTVYGGGNAAPVPETDVDIHSCYEIGSVFGGGNGKDKYKNDSGWQTNPGANVGTAEQPGNANTMIYGGTVHEAYGASNEQGTIYGNVIIDVADGYPGETPKCPLDVAKLVGAGKNADVNGDLILVMGCKPYEKIPFVYGGADNANVNGDVELTITSGWFGKVFGGNNENGCIMGHIKLNIEETGTCGTPIKIDELYLGGNKAAYSQYGYYYDGTDAEGKPILKPRTAAMAAITDPTAEGYTPTITTAQYGSEIRKTAPYDAPELNIISCTYIGEVFGGGLGEAAVMYADPTVNINMEPGALAKYIDRDKNGTPDDTSGKLLGTIVDVYGGGNAAAVCGTTTVNIGTETEVQMTSVKDPNTNELLTSQPKHTVTGAYITGDVYGGGKLANVGETHLAKDENNKDIDVIDIEGSTFVNIGAVKGTEILDAQSNPTGRYNYTSVSFTPADAPGIFIGGNVYGGGMGEAAEPEGTKALPGAFRCGKAMVTKNTNVAIGNGTIGDGNADHGHVYGGGEKGRVEENTSVTIGCENDANSKPVITGNVFGAGKGVNTHGYSALARGNSYVTVQGEAKVKKSVYGGGEIASVGKYNINAQGMPESLANQGSGYCTVMVRDNAVIGPDAAMVMTATGYPDDMGHVFGAGKGVLPYEGYADNEKAWRVTPGNTKQEYLSKTEAIAGTNEEGYLPYVETLGLATQTYVTIDENAFVKGSVYGGSENGYVQHHTQVNIRGNCQIGNGYVQMDNNGIYLDKLDTPKTPMGVNRRYTAAEWAAGRLFPENDPDYTTGTDTELENLVSSNNYYTSSLPECASWPYGQATGDDKYAPWDTYADVANYDSKGGRTTADDGHTFYGNVFGGGSGVIPYRPGKWHPEAGSVGGNTEVNITGGHILTNIYGGNELTDVYGKCTVNFGGTATLGVPRTLKQIDAHPVTCYLYGAGKGDQRVLFNKSTNVEEVEVNITGGRIYGSVFGGGEDGHVHRNVTMNISDDTSESNHTNTMIGTWGTSYVDGNVFGGGRGFGGDAYTAGNIAGSVTMNINGGTMLGSIYGGGRLGSVGYGLFNEGVDGYGEMRPNNTVEKSNPTSTTDFNRGHINITISGGTIGNDYEYIVPNSSNMPNTITQTDISKWTSENWTAWKAHNHIPKTEFDASGRLTHTKGGNVFAGGMGRQKQIDGQSLIDPEKIDWKKLGNVKQTTLTITGGKIMSNVYGGGELGAVVPYVNGNTVEGGTTQINISGTAVIGTLIERSVTTTGEGGSDVTTKVPVYTFGSVFGGGMGNETDKTSSDDEARIGGLVKGSTTITMSAGEVKGSVYGGGEMAVVQGSHTAKNSKNEDMSVGTEINISGGTIGYNQDGFGGATMGNVYGGGKGSLTTANAGLIKNNTLVKITGTPTIYHNIYGGGAYGSVGTFTFTTGAPTWPTDNPTGKTEVIVEGGTIGINGHENGMVFGSSRGDVAAPVAPSQGATPVDPNDRLAWVYDTHVVIGNSSSSGGPFINSTIYGSGENGHTFNNTLVDVNKGTIGIETDEDITYTENGKSFTKGGAAYPYRGNVYGGGCGTDMYDSNGDGTTDTFNPLAGIVLGNATVNINGGTVVRNVYGAGAMGSVGKTTTTEGVTTVSGGTTYINVSGGTIGVDGTNGDGNVFGAARGNENATINEFALVKKETSVSVTGGTIKGNVYGGGELGCVGTFTVSQDMRTFDWQDTDGNINTTANSDNKNTGVCNVTVDGSSAVINGHVYGAGKGKEDTFWCEKGIAYSTNVNIKNGTVNQNVYGGGEVGRVETDTQVKIGNGTGTAGGTIAPTITGSVFGGGAGVETHGYSALVRRNTTVTVEGNADVRKSIYGGGMIASVGRYGLDEHDMPSILQGGGYCYVTVQGSAQIGEDVFGAGKGVTPVYIYSDSNEYNVRMNNSKRMVPYSPYNETTKKGQKESDWKKTWDYVEDYPEDYSGIKFVWEYFDELSKYSTYLETLALATHPEVTIDGNATVSGSVFGGGELGLTKGSVIVTIKGGTIEEDVYGGGSLANTNTTSTVDLDGDGTTENIDPTTTVNLKGGTINRNVYGGGLGRLAKEAQGTEGEEGYQSAVSEVKAKVYGEVLVELNKPTTTTTGEGEGATTTTTYGDCEVKGTIFGCNNLNGSPQKNVTVHVYKTVIKSEGAVQPKPTKNTDIYEVTAVYGGGNLAAYYPDDATARETAIANVIIDGCDLTSIKSVYGGGNAASVPATEVVVNGTYEIGEVFGGGNGNDDVSYDGVTYVTNPGANVGYLAYTDDSDKASKVYGIGKSHATIYGGTVHTVYGGSNLRGNVRVESRTTLEEVGECDFAVGDAYGGGNNADQDGDAVLEAGCIQGLDIAYGGASNADVNGDVKLNITNGTYGRVFGGNNLGGVIRGTITVNIEETGCRPIVIGQLYGGGNLASYTVENISRSREDLNFTDPTAENYYKNFPKVNVKSFTSIGTIFGGGFGIPAELVGNPQVNVNVYEGKYYNTFKGNENVINENAKVVGTSVKYSGTGYDSGYPIPYHKKGAIGAINDVFGGGNLAKVIGNPTVNIGTEAGEEVYVAVEVKEGEELKGYCTRTGEGTTESPYQYSELTEGTAPNTATYYLKTVKAVDIRGNVFGGGNNAEVEGDTNVVIGRKKITTP